MNRTQLRISTILLAASALSATLPAAETPGNASQKREERGPTSSGL